MSALPPNASVASQTEDGKLSAPSALRNTPVIVDLLQEVAPAQGRALEIASGTGQHISALAAAIPQIDWYPTEIAADRITSIDAYAAQAALDNLRPAQLLDAAVQGWATSHTPYDLVYFGNLLHLISEKAAATVLNEAASALAPQGHFVIYGPFKRSGVLSSEGDAKFDAELRAADSKIGYKNDLWIKQILTGAGLDASLVRNMPANNLAFIAKREPS
jgi:SAM-dependent methyltransferase